MNGCIHSWMHIVLAWLEHYVQYELIVYTINKLIMCVFIPLGNGGEKTISLSVCVQIIESKKKN